MPFHHNSVIFMCSQYKNTALECHLEFLIFLPTRVYVHTKYIHVPRVHLGGGAYTEGGLTQGGVYSEMGLYLGVNS